MSVNAVAAAQAKGWRSVYFNALSIPFWGVHVLAIVGIAITGFSWWGLALALALYVPRMFFVTGAYHRYFSRRSYKTSRWFQFVLALGATFTAQKGPLWWAAHHRHHHRYSDQHGDVHSPGLQGFIWSLLGWIMADDWHATDYARIPDLAKYPELRWLNTWHAVPGIALAVVLYAAGGPSSGAQTPNNGRMPPRRQRTRPSTGN